MARPRRKAELERREASPADSGIDPETGEWTPAFEGQRSPFTETHGSYASPVAFGPRVGELADLIRPSVPTYRSGDEVALRVLCLALARLERSADAQGQVSDTTELHRLRQDERGWANTVRRYLDDLGLTPMARARLKLDVAMTSRALTLTGLVEEAQLEAEAVEEEPGS